MANQTHDEPTITHTDAYSQDLGQPVSLRARLTVDSDDETGDTARGTTAVEVSHPVDDPVELERTAHLMPQLAREHRSNDGEVRHD